MKTVMVIAGSDSCGGAGLQADLRTLAACDVHGACIVTSVTAQDTASVRSVFAMPPEVVGAQLDAVLGDLSISAVKSGVLGSRGAIAAIAERIRPLRAPYVLDPVAVASSGGVLSDAGAVDEAQKLLFPLAALVTPNVPEVEALTGIRVRDRTDAGRAGNALLRSGCGAVLVTGGHLPGDAGTDVLVTSEKTTVFEGTPVIATANTHGTGCTLASAIAAGLAKGATLVEAIVSARSFTAQAIKDGYRIGRGPGPVNQFGAICRSVSERATQ